MTSYLEELSMTEAENVKRTIRDLFRQTCILQVKYDPATLIRRDNPRYETCVRHRAFIEQYLSVLGCELTHDPQEHIFRLTGEGVATERLNLTTTLLILILKLIYRDKIMGEGLNATVTTLEEMREYGKYQSDHQKADGCRVERCAVCDEGASDDRCAGSRQRCGRYHTYLYLQYDQSVLCITGY